MKPLLLKTLLKPLLPLSLLLLSVGLFHRQSKQVVA